MKYTRGWNAIWCVWGIYRLYLQYLVGLSHQLWHIPKIRYCPCASEVLERCRYKDHDKARNASIRGMYCADKRPGIHQCPLLVIKLKGQQMWTRTVCTETSAAVVLMTSSNESIFCVTGPLCGEFTGLPRTKASDAELSCFLWSAPG